MTYPEFMRSLRYDRKYAISAAYHDGWNTYVADLRMNEYTTFKYFPDDKEMNEFLDFIDGNGFVVLEKWRNDSVRFTWEYATVKRLPNEHR